MVLAKINRLKKKRDFYLVFKKGKTQKGKFLILKYIKNNLKESRFAFIISQKISKKTVVRNKIKRRLSEIVREKLKEFREKIDGIFIALSGIENQNFQVLKNDVEEIFKKLKI